ncbi:hypothetical protein SLH46_18415 [Draconibacterium sp. IB214405]|uniref:hypothetical protein n=1 Tax=Draconibacterium sp. IB214405 TaxID=3097352 RepID=UPI002A12C877|nr:hypothetical protein [Draconibacterium sp. IB214405]MDX8341179.1 hypothetical protein [Draconibacterium sp. IB214405]
MRKPTSQQKLTSNRRLVASEAKQKLDPAIKCLKESIRHTNEVTDIFNGYKVYAGTYVDGRGRTWQPQLHGLLPNKYFELLAYVVFKGDSVNVFYPNHFLTNTIMEVIHEFIGNNSQDKARMTWTEYFCFELDFGRKYKPGMIKEKQEPSSICLLRYNCTTFFSQHQVDNLN